MSFLCTVIHTGKYNDLEILRDTTVGLFLGDDEGEEDVLLPRKYCPETFEIGDRLNVFVYRDSEDRKIATNLIPKILLHQFAVLKVNAVSNMGAFLDWGLEKDLLVPFSEQKNKLEEGRSYVVYLELDEVTDRLFASAKIDKYLENEFLRVEQGEEVELLVYSRSDLGYSVIVNGVHKGLIYATEVFKPMPIGTYTSGFVKLIRPDNKLDITLQIGGYENTIEPNTDQILNKLEMNQGVLPYGDKSSPESIYKEFGMSKKAFKKAIGNLYKDRKIEIDEEEIRLVKS